MNINSPTPNRDPTFIKPTSHFGETFFFHVNILPLFSGIFLFKKACVISSNIAEKHLTKSINTEAKLMSSALEIHLGSQQLLRVLLRQTMFL